MPHAVRRLAPLFLPEQYTLTIDVSGARYKKFHGQVVIKGRLRTAQDGITLHAHDLSITAATIDDHTATATYGADDELTITTGKKLAPGTYVLRLTFTGDITDAMHGLYPCRYTQDGKSKQLLATQLESHSAREVFPCIDEPIAKATFDLTLITQPGLTALSNTPVATQKTSAKNLHTTFHTTPRMSTYLLAFVVGDLRYLEAKSASGVTIRTYSTPHYVEQTRFALELAAKTLDIYNDFFGTPYPLAKCDFVAVPEFSAGAMENWGLIVARENCLFVDPANTTEFTKQYIGVVVTHELAHQWFGNLVTMAWWDDLWLNESFANWMQYYTLHQLFPEWRVWDQFNVGDQQLAFNRDGLANVQAVREPITNPEEVPSVFDKAIVYGKGSSLLRMLHTYLGNDAFRAGVRQYIQAHAYGNATMTDLWQAFSQASGRPVVDFMQSWVTQPGHPVVTFHRTDGHATVQQQRYFMHPERARSQDDTLWPIPLTSNEPLFTTASTSVTIPHAERINADATGFYHVLYDAQALQNIQPAALLPVQRQRLLQDYLAFAIAGLDTTPTLLRLLVQYKNETDYSVWEAIDTVLRTLTRLINEDATVVPHLRRLIAHLCRTPYATLGWDQTPNEHAFHTLLRPVIVHHLTYAQQPDIIAKALATCNAASVPSDIPVELRESVYIAAIRQPNATQANLAYKKILHWYKNEQSNDERLRLGVGLTCVRTPKLAKQTVAMLSTPDVRLQDTHYWFQRLMKNISTRDIVWQWMQDNWAWIDRSFKGDIHYSDFPLYAALGCRTRQQLEQFHDFFDPMLGDAGLNRTIRQAIEDIEARVLWRERDLPSILEFLRGV